MLTNITNITVAIFIGKPKPNNILNIAYSPIINNGVPIINESKD